MYRTLALVLLVACSSPSHVALVPIPVSPTPAEPTNCDLTLTCYDGTEAGLLAGCALGSPVCVKVPQSDGGFGEEIIECREESLYLDGGCQPLADCFAATNQADQEVTVCTPHFDGGN
jgi:hypothetical protein